MTKEATATLGFNISDTGALHDAAVAAYVRSQGEGSRDDALSFLGPRENPNVQACIAEVICDKDDKGLFEPVY